MEQTPAFPATLWELPQNTDRSSIIRAEYEEINIKMQEKQPPLVSNHKTEEEWSCKVFARWHQVSFVGDSEEKQRTLNDSQAVASAQHYLHAPEILEQQNKEGFRDLSLCCFWCSIEKHY